MASSFLRYLDHTQRCTTVGRTPLDEWSAHCRDLNLTTHNTHNRQTSMPPVGFEPTISAGERPQTYVLDWAATGNGIHFTCMWIERPLGPASTLHVCGLSGHWDRHPLYMYVDWAATGIGIHFTCMWIMFLMLRCLTQPYFRITWYYSLTVMCNPTIKKHQYQMFDI